MIRRPKKFYHYPQAALVVFVMVVFGFVIFHVFAASPVIGDLNHDGVVNIFDLSIMLSDWGTNNSTADLNNDGTVNIFDLSILLSHWDQTGSTPTPAPTPTPTPTPTPSATPVSQICANPSHTIPMDPSNAQTGVSIGNFYVTNDTWNASKYQVAQTLYVCDYNNWYVVANTNNNSGDGAVKTYPNVHEDFSNEPLISSFHTISSTFAETGPHVGIYEYAYDMWLNGVASNGSTEVMIWNDNYGQTPGGSKVGTFSDGGQNYNVYRSGSYIAFVDTANITSGTVNILDFYNNIISRGWIPATSTVGQIDYGAELVSTNGQNATFQVNNFSLTAN
jgi:glycosyl hydrolase family 12/dockerin type I repeat protein